MIQLNVDDHKAGKWIVHFCHFRPSIFVHFHDHHGSADRSEHPASKKTMFYSVSRNSVFINFQLGKKFDNFSEIFFFEKSEFQVLNL